MAISFNQKIIDEFRSNDGRVGGDFAGAELLLLSTTGAKSGLLRTNPLAFVRDAGEPVVFAAYAGAESNPPWYYNLLAEPKVVVEVGEDKYPAVASIVNEPARTRLYGEMTTMMSAFEKYKERTSRIIPVIRLTRDFGQERP